MDEVGAPNETSAEALTQTSEQNAAPSALEPAIQVSACEPAALVSVSDTSDPSRKVEIRIKLGFDDQSLQGFLSSLKNGDRLQPQTSEYISLTAPFKDEGFASARKRAGDEQGLRISPIALIVIFAVGFGLKLHFHDIHFPVFPDQAGSSIKGLVDRIVMSESQGNPDARNKFSSAAGLGQFINATWMALIKKHRPDLAGAMSDKEILDLRKDPELSREMTARYVEQNTSILMKKGLPVTPGSLYLAHFAGPGGAAAILSAPEEVDAATVIASVDGQPARTREKIVNGNPFLKGFTVKDLKNWAHLKMQGINLEPAAPPALEN
ncbi:transglycosylase SLT domain-containing protein [Methylocystis sp.]|uniref:transglycosylase SLT domain-containing protein n=1 Tax=Methylocystis sp. TaxID=1911079 RepID=UPI0025CDF273|nr:transglycosylase SLT domain-containing protein [Methylocystis sp.]